VTEERLKPPQDLRLSIRTSKIVGGGDGLFGTLSVGIDRDVFLGVYAGEVVVDDGELHPYAVACWDSLIVDGAVCGNEFRFLQNSHRPTVEIRDLQVSQRGITGWIPGVFSFRPIEPGTIELTALYSFFPTSKKHFFPCECGYMKCTRFQSIRADNIALTSEYLHLTSAYLAVSLLCPSDLVFTIVRHSEFSMNPLTSSTSSLHFYHMVKMVTSHLADVPVVGSGLLSYTLTWGHYYYLDSDFLPLIKKVLQKVIPFIGWWSPILIARFIALVDLPEGEFTIFQVL